MKKRKTLPKDFEALLQDDAAFRAVFEKCDINAYGGYSKGNALFFDVSEAQMDWLLEQGCELEYKNIHDCTPFLFHAGKRSGEQQALLLLRHGADPHVTERFTQQNALFFAAECGHTELLRALLDAGLSPRTVSDRGLTPLTYAFFVARTFDLIPLVPVTRLLLEGGAEVTEEVRQHFRRVAEDIEFRRQDLNPEYVPELDAAMETLYALLHVEPVPRRAVLDVSQPLTVRSTTWQKQHAELWDLLVPGSGHASTVQGEAIRIIGRLLYEILDNGCMNWDRDFVALGRALSGYLRTGNLLDDAEYAEIQAITTDIKNKNEAELYRLNELTVKWVLLNPQLVPVGKITYRR